MKYRRTPPAATVNRMARYLNYLAMLPADQDRVSSEQISRALGIKPTQFRQDFHYFGGFGRPGRGYDRRVLIEVLEKILGVDAQLPTVVIGIGHLGTALVNYRYFERLNIKLVGLFDINPKLIGLVVRGIEIRHPSELAKVAKEQDVKIAVITTPHEVAQMICNLAVEAGIKGIWNFTPVPLTAPAGYIVRNEQPALGLLALTFQIRELDYAESPSAVERKSHTFD